MGITHPKFKAAVVQAAPVWLDLEGTVAKTITYIEEAAREGAKLIAFPETWIPGYPWHIWVGTPAWTIGRGFVQRYFDNSLSYDSPLARKIAEAARDNRITVVLGLSERDGGSLYISQWLIGPDGETIAKRRNGFWRRRRKPYRGARACRRGQTGCAVLLGAPTAADQVRYVRPERAGACGGVAQFLHV